MTPPLANLEHYVGQEVHVQGWVDRVRDLKQMQFVVLRDHTGRAQLTNVKDGSDLERRISSLVPESTVSARGDVVYNERVKLNPYEIQVKGIEITSEPSGPLPIDENSSPDLRMDWRYLDLRRPENLLKFQVQTATEQAMREFWIKEGFIEIHSPKFVKGATESGSELFTLDYFGETASLAQSPQFYKQMAMASGFGRIFEIGPVYRANPSHTVRHDTEFTSVDMEISWIDSHEDVMQMEERWLNHVIGSVAARYGEAIERTFGTALAVPQLPFPRVTLAQARDLLSREYGHELEKPDLDPRGERLLSQYIREQSGHQFVFVTDYPIETRAFYHMRHADNPHLTKSFDLLWNGLEVTTGAQREHRHDILRSQAIEKGVDPDSIQHYLDFFRHGCPPHGGLGVGLTRLLMPMLNQPNVREVTYLYRGPTRLTP